jgi:DMSO reductase anchor subunit
MVDAFFTVWLLCGIGAAAWSLWLIRDYISPRDLMMATMLVCAGPIGLLFVASMVWGDDGEDEE